MDSESDDRAPSGDPQAEQRSTARASESGEDSQDSRDSAFPLDSLFASEAEPGTEQVQALVVGVKVGRYELLSKIGEGGMGAVFLAHDDRLERKVAVKVLRTDRSGKGGNARMLREARALARVSHPNVVQVYDSGEQGDNVYIAMEYIDGLTLRRWLAARERSIEEVCTVFTAAGRGLAAAHAQGLVHRDFKPDNVMIGHDGRVRVMDFGLVRKQGGSAEHSHTGISVSRDTEPEEEAVSEQLTMTGTLLGTPAYMAPEQHRSEAIDARTDQFSFCVAFWEALYRQRPFEGRTVLGLASAILAGKLTPTPPEAKVPPDLRDIVRRGLEAEPSARWPSMNELLAALEQRGEARRGGLPLAFGALALGALALGVGGTLLVLRAQDPASTGSPTSAAEPVEAARPAPSPPPPDLPPAATAPPTPEARETETGETETGEDEGETETGTDTSAPAPSEARRPKPSKKKPALPETVSETQLDAGLASVAKACSTAVPRTIWVEFAIAKSGRVTNARALPPNDASTLGSCVLDALRGHRFPASLSGLARRKASIKVSR